MLKKKCEKNWKNVEKIGKKESEEIEKCPLCHVVSRLMGPKKQGFYSKINCSSFELAVFCEWHICPVNLHPLFLFGKPGLVCDLKKKTGTLLFEKMVTYT